MEPSKLQPKVLNPELPVEDLKRLTDFFEILIQIDQRERKKQCKK